MPTSDKVDEKLIIYFTWPKYYIAYTEQESDQLPNCHVIVTQSCLHVLYNNYIPFDLVHSIAIYICI